MQCKWVTMYAVRVYKNDILYTEIGIYRRKSNAIPKKESKKYSTVNCQIVTVVSVLIFYSMM